MKAAPLLFSLLPSRLLSFQQENENHLKASYGHPPFLMDKQVQCKEDHLPVAQQQVEIAFLFVHGRRPCLRSPMALEALAGACTCILVHKDASAC